MAEYTRADVYLQGSRVGGILESQPDGKQIFQYDPAFAATGIEISPLNLPTSDITPVQYQIGYEDYFDVIRRLGLPQSAVTQAFTRMVFSLATVNYDDHLKNFAFLMDEAGEWRLSPAYDVAFAENDGWTRQHQMSVAASFGVSRERIV